VNWTMAAGHYCFRAVRGAAKTVVRIGRTTGSNPSRQIRLLSSLTSQSRRGVQQLRAMATTPTSQQASSFEEDIKARFPSNSDARNQGLQLLQKINEESGSRDSIMDKEFEQMCEEIGIQCGDIPAYVECLEQHGHAIKVSSLRRTNSLIYLHPTALISSSNILIDPEGKFEGYREACSLKANEELNEMKSKEAAIDRQALMGSKIRLFAASSIITGYVGLTGYLTSCVFSWDTMEPLTYFFGAAVGVVAVAYSGLREKQFDFHEQYEQWKDTGRKSLCERQRFDFKRYENLKQYIRRLQ